MLLEINLLLQPQMLLVHISLNYHQIVHLLLGFICVSDEQLNSWENSARLEKPPIILQECVYFKLLGMNYKYCLNSLKHFLKISSPFLLFMHTIHNINIHIVYFRPYVDNIWWTNKSSLWTVDMTLLWWFCMALIICIFI